MQIADDTQIRHFQQRRRAIGVDCDDRLAAADSGDVLGRTGHAKRDVQLGRHNSAGGADKAVGGQPTAIRHHARPAQSGVQFIGQLL
jgi:hypothetical protein